MTTEGQNIWRKAHWEYGSALLMICMKSELEHTGFRILDGMADSLYSPPAMREVAETLMEYLDLKVEKLYEFVMSMFPGEEILKAENTHAPQKHIINYIFDEEYLRDLHNEVGRYNSTKELVTDYLEKEVNVA